MEQTRPLENPALAAAVSGPSTQGAICGSLMRQESAVSVCVCMSARSFACVCLLLLLLLHDRVWLIHDMPAQRQADCCY